MAQLNVFALVTLVVVIMVLIFLILTVVYFYRIWRLQPPSIGEAIALFWTGIVFIVLYIALGIYCLWHLFSHTEKVVAVDHHHHHHEHEDVPVELYPAPAPEFAPACAVNEPPVFIEHPPEPIPYSNPNPYPYSYPSIHEAAPTPLSPYPPPISYPAAAPVQFTRNSAPNVLVGPQLSSAAPQPRAANRAFTNGAGINANGAGTTRGVPALATSLSDPPTVAQIPLAPAPLVAVPTSSPPVTITSQPPKLIPIAMAT